MSSLELKESDSREYIYCFKWLLLWSSAFLKAVLLLCKINTVITSWVWGVMVCCSVVFSLGVVGCCPVLYPGAALPPGLHVHPRGPIPADVVDSLGLVFCPYSDWS